MHVDVDVAVIDTVQVAMLQVAVLDDNAGSSWRYKQPLPANMINPFASNIWLSKLMSELSLQHFKYS